MTNPNGARQDPALVYSTGPATVGLTDAAAALERLLATATDENARAALLRARRAIAQTGGGRPAIDDTLALQDVEELLSTGRAKSFRRVAFMVVRARYPFSPSHKSIVERFRRKWKTFKKIAT